MPPHRLLTVLAVSVVGLVLGSAALAHGTAQTKDKTLAGTLRTWHGDTLDAPVSLGAGIDPGIASLVPLTAAGPSVQKLAGKRVTAKGQYQRGAFAAGGGVQASGGTTATATTGAKTVGVILFNFTNNASQPWTHDTVRGVLFDNTNSVDAYYREASWGQLSISGAVHGWYTIPDDDAGCDYTGWATKARTEAQNAGVNLSAYQYLVYAFPSTSSCGWAGLAYLPGTGSWINGAMNLRVVGHELGHNFGVHHASTLRCTSAGVYVPLSATCEQPSEYGDPYTIMGSASTRHHNNWHRAQLGWVSDTLTVATSGVYNLAPAEMAGGPRMLRIARTDGTFLNLEYRQPYGTQFDNFGATDPVVNGVSVRIAPNTSSLVQSKLIDGSPTTSGWAFGVGQSLTDPATNVQITVVSVSPAGASVSIQFAPDSQAPTQPGSLVASPLGSTSIRLTWAASTDNTAVTGYRVYRGSTLVTTTTSLTFTDTGLSPSTTYGYEVRAIDAATNASTPATASATTATLDTTAPTTPTGVSATKGKGRRVDVRWNAASDNVAVTGYWVYRNGAKIAETAGLTFRDNPGRGSFTYTLRAVDAAGNQSVQSPGVTVTT